jgi:hypothetical protein
MYFRNCVKGTVKLIFLYCCSYIVSSELRLGMDSKFVFALGPETSLTRPANLVTITCLSPFNGRSLLQSAGQIRMKLKLKVA